VLDDLVLALLEKETLDKAEVARIFEPLKRRAPRPAWTGSETRKPSALPPVISPKEINGHQPERDPEEGTIVLAPGQGGEDIHGPGSGPTGGTPEPPSPGVG
jgi:cell division protease FtsH